MKTFFRLLLFVLIPSLVMSGGLEASFLGANLDHFPGAGHNTVFELNATKSQLFDATTGAWRDGWENLVTYSRDFDSWGLYDVSVVADSYKNPVDGLKDADTIHEGSFALDGHFVYQSIPVVAGHKYTRSVYAKKLNREWLELYNIGTTYRNTNYNLSTGVLGTASANTTDVKISHIAGDWYRCSYSWVESTTESVQFRTYPAKSDAVHIFDGLNQDSIVVYGAQVTDNTDGTIVGPGTLIHTGSSAKPRLDLTASVAGIPFVKSSFQGSDGNRLDAVSLNGSTQYFSRAHHDAMNVFDGSFTLTMVSQNLSSVGYPYIFAHGLINTAGVYMQTDTSEYIAFNFNNNGSRITVPGPTGIFTLGYYHVVQVVRTGNNATVIVDGISGTTTDVTGFGIDGSYAMYFGCANGGFSTWPGSILYARLDGVAQSDAMLAKDREYAWNLLANNGLNTPSWTFTRGSTAKSEFSTGGIRETAINVPRIGRDGGYLGEGQRTNRQENSEELEKDFSDVGGQVTTWSVNDTLAPDGTLTADTIIDENGMNDTAAMGASTISVTNGTVYTYDFYVRKHPDGTSAGNTVWVRLLNGAHDSRATYNVVGCSYTSATGTAAISHFAYPAGDGWCRMGVTITALQTGTLSEYIALNNNVAYLGTGAKQVTIWGMQLEANSFATTYCGPVPDGLNLTCLADSLVLDPHPAGTNKRVLAETYGPSPNPANKLTIEFEAKAEWIDTPNANKRPLHIGGTSTNRVNVYHGSGRKRFWVGLYDSVGSIADYYVDTTGMNMSQWHKFKIFIDFSDISRNTVAIDGVNQVLVGAHTGTYTLSTVGQYVYVGRFASPGYEFDGEIKDLRILPREY